MTTAMDKGLELFARAKEAMENEDFDTLQQCGKQALPFMQEAGEEGAHLVPDCHMFVGMGLFQQGRHDEAIPHFERMLAAHDRNPGEMLNAASAFAKDYFDAGAVDKVLHWFDLVASSFDMIEGPRRALGADAWIGKYQAMGDADPEASFKTLDAAWEAALRDPYGFLLSDRAKGMGPEYRRAGKAARAVPYVDRAIDAMWARYRSGQVAPPADESDPDDGFMGDRVRFSTFAQALRDRNATPRPIVTLNAERARLLIDIPGREDDVLKSAQVVLDAIAADAKVAQPKGGLFGKLVGSFVKVKTMDASAADDVYEPDLYYALGEAKRRKLSPAEAKTHLKTALSRVDEDEDPELVGLIKAAMGTC